MDISGGQYQVRKRGTHRVSLLEPRWIQKGGARLPLDPWIEECVVGAPTLSIGVLCVVGTRGELCLEATSCCKNLTLQSNSIISGAQLRCRENGHTCRLADKTPGKYQSSTRSLISVTIAGPSATGKLIPWNSIRPSTPMRGGYLTMRRSSTSSFGNATFLRSFP